MSRIFRRSLSSITRVSQPSPVADDGARFAAHLNNVFPSLHFPPALAQRILTHGGHKLAPQGHNARLSFVGKTLSIPHIYQVFNTFFTGRRVLESYYLLFLHSVARTQNQHDYEYLSSRALNSYLLGEHIAPRWSLGRIVQWAPAVSQDVLTAHKIGKNSQQPADVQLENALQANRGFVKSVGLYKVMGEAVQSVVGGIYHQFVRPFTLYALQT
jgi:hypothetical protein